ncbi:hypothetical protein [Streptomyces sp. NBC_01481]|uniref:hypothetical protein n=1 Tax=Streptomyces sp. NBC_01481 TaxID=2975869 RepID=UPI00225A1382|nr:hypothetical protein [Streptomyces sp. NBC_01481]MCX4585299.1 hypothetical protein [Streptomyces sp. NBC_01481]
MAQYKGSRAEAEHTAALLRAALMRAGIPEGGAAQVRALVTGKGRAYVEVGALPLGSAVKLLNALSEALPDDDTEGGPARHAEALG